MSIETTFELILILSLGHRAESSATNLNRAGNAVAIFKTLASTTSCRMENVNNCFHEALFEFRERDVVPNVKRKLYNNDDKAE